MSSTEKAKKNEETETEDVTTLDSHMPAPPSDGTFTTQDSHMPTPPADDTVTTLDSHMPAPPALDLHNN